MKQIKTLLISTLLIFSCNSQAVSTLNNPSTTDTVHLKTDCTGVNDCAETLVELIPWIWNVRNPTINSPLVVKIGPGNFHSFSSSINGGSFCKDSGYVTFIGSGKENTVIKNSSSLSGIDIRNCESLVFQDLTFDFKDTIYGIFWSGDGSSHYTNVQLLGGGAAWYDTGCSGTGTSVHYFISSQIKATGKLFSPTTAYLARCSETWFIGSEITTESNGAPVSTISALSDGSISSEIHIYGSSLRAESADNINLTTGKRLIAVTATTGADVHIHGTGIDVISKEANDITALVANGGTIHANQSAYVLKTATGGVKTRLENNGGVIMAPYVWGNHTNTTGITTIHGADISVSTDNTDGQPHMLIYSTNCTSKWFDSTANQCRQ